FASCYGSSPPLHLFGKGPRGGGYMSLFAYRGPHYVPRPRVGGHAPRMTLRQICRMLKLIKQIKKREAAAVGVAS
uniref:Si:ch211-172l8.4 n=1 Tax=Cynoglossus semilaevis TaxID=244447 RepID=A0A3P8WAT7_CYNSE